MYFVSTFFLKYSLTAFTASFEAGAGVLVPGSLRSGGFRAEFAGAFPLILKEHNWLEDNYSTAKSD